MANVKTIKPEHLLFSDISSLVFSSLSLYSPHFLARYTIGALDFSTKVLNFTSDIVLICFSFKDYHAVYKSLVTGIFVLLSLTVVGIFLVVLPILFLFCFFWVWGLGVSENNGMYFQLKNLVKLWGWDCLMCFKNLHNQLIDF